MVSFGPGWVSNPHMIYLFTETIYAEHKILSGTLPAIKLYSRKHSAITHSREFKTLDLKKQYFVVYPLVAVATYY